MRTFQLPMLSRLSGLRCVFTGRGEVPRPDPAGLVGLLGLDEGVTAPLAIVRQIHSNRWLLARRDPDEGEKGRLLGEGDAILTIDRGLALGIATADCLPIVAVDPEACVLAAVHAGWKGTLAGVLSAALGAMRREMGARPERIHVGVGPCVGSCCYRVGEEVVDSFRSERGRHAGKIISRGADGSARLDLLEANRLQALDEGVAPERFEALGLCTVCRPDLFHSYRRDGPSAGRMWMLAALA